MDNEPTLEITKDGDKRWRLNSRRHRVDSPAVEFVNDTKLWELPNVGLHRVDGPAVEWANGDKAWYLDGRGYKFDEWLEANTYISEEEKLMLKLIHG
jgi:hypothetical protein